MDYQAHYDRLIARARGRTLTGYKERHHVVPRCLGGTNRKVNLVDLTAEEHYVANQLLVKMYPSVYGLATAAVYMAKQCTGNKAYGWLRRRHAIAAARAQTGRKMPPGTGAKISAKRRLWEISEETAKKISAANKGRKFTPEHKAKIAAALKGKPKSKAHAAAVSEAKKGKPFPQLSPESIERRRAAITGKPLSQDRKDKIGAANRGRRQSPEHRAKIAESLRRWNSQRTVTQ